MLYLQVLNDLLVKPGVAPVLDPEVNGSMLRQLQRAAGSSRSQERGRFAQLRIPEKPTGLRKPKNVNSRRENDEENRERKEKELEGRRKKALQDIQDMERMMERRHELEAERLRLAKLLEGGDGLDLSLAPSSRSLSWWRRAVRRSRTA